MTWIIFNKINSLNVYPAPTHDKSTKGKSRYFHLGPTRKYTENIQFITHDIY
ncbi:hypothetical protein M23134_05063 [Microscilla marina ATCC 23134]|uniref:Uncharacterized protein n=1 Tax=Microscilla marina ATCC 23134 TaxID=313606 RepID=A1ZD18_MICM2|nr:hypothetical protein M23134_05063 [Microscilla marina ATCC 23134]